MMLTVYLELLANKNVNHVSINNCKNIADAQPPIASHFINLYLLPNNIYNYLKKINLFKQLFVQIALPCVWWYSLAPAISFISFYWYGSINRTLFIATIIYIMSGIVNLYIPAANFVNTIYTPSEDGTQITLAGTVNGQPINATSSIGPNNFLYYGQAKANFLSGSEAACQVPEKEKGHKWTLRPPKVKGAKSPEKGPSLEEQLQRQVKHNPLKRPQTTVVQLPKEKDPVGVISGTYIMTSLPWPTDWKVYLKVNNQISGGPGLVYEYLIAAHPSEVSEDWEACFSVANFTSKGEVFTYPFSNNYNLNPYVNAFFDFNVYGVQQFP